MVTLWDWSNESQIKQNTRAILIMYYNGEKVCLVYERWRKKGLPTHTNTSAYTEAHMHTYPHI